MLLNKNQYLKIYSQVSLILILFTFASSFYHGSAVSSSVSRISLKQNTPLNEAFSFSPSKPLHGSKKRSMKPRIVPLNSVAASSKGDKEDAIDDDSNSVRKFTKRGLKILAGSTIIFKLATNAAVKKTVNKFFLLNPFIAAFTVCAIKASSADFIVQKTEQNDTKFEFKRNLAFILYGGAYQGCVQEYIFNHVYPFMFGSGTDILTVFIKVFVDMLIISPFLCLPVAYMIKGTIYKNSISQSIKRYIYDVKENNLLKNYWMIWGPTQCITFSLIPEHYRISFIAFIGFFWLLILSSISGKKQVEAKSL